MPVGIDLGEFRAQPSGSLDADKKSPPPVSTERIKNARNWALLALSVDIDVTSVPGLAG
jgi:hypothetical protein